MTDMRGFDGIPRFHSVDPGAPAEALLEQAREAAAARDQLNDIAGEATTDDGLIRAAVGAQGLQDLRLDPRAMRMPSEDLAKAIVAVAAAARDDLFVRRAERARELGLPTQPPSLDDSLAQLATLKGLVDESQGDARRVFERFQQQTGR